MGSPTLMALRKKILAKEAAMMRYLRPFTAQRRVLAAGPPAEVLAPDDDVSRKITGDERGVRVLHAMLTQLLPASLVTR